MAIGPCMEKICTDVPINPCTNNGFFLLSARGINEPFGGIVLLATRKLVVIERKTFIVGIARKRGEGIRVSENRKWFR